MILSLVSLVRRAHTWVPAPLLTVLSLVLLHVGSAGAVHLFDTAGPLEVTWAAVELGRAPPLRTRRASPAALGADRHLV